MNGLNQFFQVTAPGLQTFQYSRSVGSHDDCIFDNDRGVLAPGCSAVFRTKSALMVCGEMSGSLEIQFDGVRNKSIGVFYPFFVLNFPVKKPCSADLWLINKENFPIDYKLFWAKEQP